jgi:hypothetical protein
MFWPLNGHLQGNLYKLTKHITRGTSLKVSNFYYLTSWLRTEHKQLYFSYIGFNIWYVKPVVIPFVNSVCVFLEDSYLTAGTFQKYRVIKMSLCTCWLQHMSFLPHYLAQSDCLAADRQGQGDTRLTLMSSVIPNSNYIIMVSDWNCLKYFCVFFVLYHQLHTDFLINL